MTALLQHRCDTHPAREAVARCPECRRPCCRECVTEHDGRLLCASCLRRLLAPKARRRLRLGWLFAPVHLATGLLLAWFTWYTLGRVLLLIPSDWHEGSRIEKLLLPH